MAIHSFHVLYSIFNVEIVCGFDHNKPRTTIFQISSFCCEASVIEGYGNRLRATFFKSNSKNVVFFNVKDFFFFFVTSFVLDDLHIEIGEYFVIVEFVRIDVLAIVDVDVVFFEICVCHPEFAVIFV